MEKENVLEKLAPLVPSDKVFEATFPGSNYVVGPGLHDSSAALIPYLLSFQEPFILISTGTWCISFNPFNSQPLTIEELKQDCLCYLQYKGNPVKASRLFAGFIHDHAVRNIAEHFDQSIQKYRALNFDPSLLTDYLKMGKKFIPFHERDISSFASDEEAYHHLVYDIVLKQKIATDLIIQDSNVKRLFVDGGFSKNVIYMNLLSRIFSEMEVFAASMAQATAVGTALAIHQAWNPFPIPNDLIELKFYASIGDTV